MTDLATRIEALFYKRWPIGQLSEHEWLAKCDRLEVMLSCGAFESALMQFCVPENPVYILAAIAPEKTIINMHSKPLGTVGDWYPMVERETPAEALCAALEAAWAEVEKG